MKGYEKGKLPKVIFGSGSAKRVSGELTRMGASKCLLITGRHMIKHWITGSIIQDIKNAGIYIEIFSDVTPEPEDDLCMLLGNRIRKNAYDCVIAVGGGSPMDAAKAACLIAGIPEGIDDLHTYGKGGTRMKECWHRPCSLILMPTTSGTGAETTASAVISSNRHGLKFSFGNSSTGPDLCIIDPDFTLGMPVMPTVYGGVDAMAHIIEILVGTGANEYTEVILAACLEKIWKWLPVAVNDPDSKEAREQLSWAAHNALANGGVPNGHAAAHAIGSLYHITHGHACMMVLPTVIRHFAETSPQAIRLIAEKIGIELTGHPVTDAENTAAAIAGFGKKFGLKTITEVFAERGIDDSEDTFVEKMLPVVMDDFKSREWMPPIHTGDWRAKAGEVCRSIYREN